MLPGGHSPGCKVDILMVLKGKLNAEGFLSAVGVTASAVDDQTRQRNMYYVNSVPCTVLISTGIGSQDSFTECTNNCTCFISWALHCNDQAIYR